MCVRRSYLFSLRGGTGVYTATVAQEASNPGVQKMIDDSTVLNISIRPSSVRGVSPVGCGFHSVLRRALQLRVIVAGAHTHTRLVSRSLYRRQRIGWHAARLSLLCSLLSWGAEGVYMCQGRVSWWCMNRCINARTLSVSIETLRHHPGIRVGSVGGRKGGGNSPKSNRHTHFALAGPEQSSAHGGTAVTYLSPLHSLDSGTDVTPFRHERLQVADSGP